MDNFCGFCGRKLSPGEACGCQEGAAPVQPPVDQAARAPASPPPPAYTPPAQSPYAQMPPQAPPPYYQQPAQQPYYQQPVRAGSTVGGFLKSFFSNPGKAAEELLASPKKNNAYIIALIGIAVNALYICTFFARALSSISSFSVRAMAGSNRSESYYLQSFGKLLEGAFGGLFEELESMLDYRFDMTLQQFFSEVKLPYLGFILSAVACTVVALLAMALIWMLIGSLSRRSLGFQQSLSSVCVASYASTIFMVLATLLLFVSFQFSLVCVAVAVVSFGMSSCVMLKGRLGADSGIMQYLYGALFVITVILGYMVFSSIFGPQLLKISWRGYSLEMLGGTNLLQMLYQLSRML